VNLGICKLSQGLDIKFKRTVLLFILGVKFLKYSYIVIKNENYQFDHRGCLLISEFEYELDKRSLKK